MGHVTIVNEDINEARKVAQEVKKTIKVISKLNQYEQSSCYHGKYK